MLLYQGRSLIDGSPIVCIATYSGRADRANRKTGDMIQTWILRADMSPLDASKMKEDGAICGDCPHRQSMGGGCYVSIFQAPQSVYHAWQRGTYGTESHLEKLNAALSMGVPLRIGSYGDPMAVPSFVWKNLLAIRPRGAKWTGYTHQWNALRRPDRDSYRSYLMASVDSGDEAAHASILGWRYFLVTGSMEIVGALECPNTTHGVQCEDCGLCNGVRPGPSQAKSIYIRPHGPLKSRLLPVVS